ncbi:hypothetical protein AVEN_150137-1, partial [Araneus ventricosus]
DLLNSSSTPQPGASGSQQSGRTGPSFTKKKSESSSTPASFPAESSLEEKRGRTDRDESDTHRIRREKKLKHWVSSS